MDKLLKQELEKANALIEKLLEEKKLDKARIEDLENKFGLMTRLVKHWETSYKKEKELRNGTKVSSRNI